MNVLITGATGLIGRALTRSLLADGHKVWALTRKPDRAILPLGAIAVQWDARTSESWGHLVNDMDAIVNLAGRNTAVWPWTKARMQEFWNSRVWAGQAVTEAVRAAHKKPKVLIQQSGVNYYGLRGDDMAVESTSAGDDFLARLTIAWEFSSQPVEEMGVRRAVTRSGIVLSLDAIILKLIDLPIRLFVGGRLGSGNQYLPWIHIDDEVGALRFLLENERARGAFNLVAPDPLTSDAFLRTLSRTLNRPYWFHLPAFILRLPLGAMSRLVLEGRNIFPKRLHEAGYEFKFVALDEALSDLYG